jgi:hypothetical protein
VPHSDACLGEINKCPGTRISLYGQLPVTDQPSDTTTTKASISIDDGMVSNISIPPNPLGGPFANSLLYDSTLSGSELNPGNHTLKVEVPHGSSFVLDYILVKPVQGPADLVEGTSAAMETPMPTAGSMSGTGSSKGISLGVIVGGVIAGLVCALLVLGGGLLWRRRKGRVRPDFLPIPGRSRVITGIERKWLLCILMHRD